jgi:hypothetical protein
MAEFARDIRALPRTVIRGYIVYQLAPVDTAALVAGASKEPFLNSNNDLRTPLATVLVLRGLADQIV